MSAREPLPPSAIERNAVNIQRAVVAVCVLLVAGDVAFTFLGHRHTHFAFEGYIGVYGAVGFVSYVGLVLSAKVLRKLVMRPEDFYERPAVATVASALPVPPAAHPQPAAADAPSSAEPSVTVSAESEAHPQPAATEAPSTEDTSVAASAEPGAPDTSPIEPETAPEEDPS